MRLFGAMDISASGLTAQRLRLDLIASNLANANTTRTEQGGPYRRQVAVMEQRGPSLFSRYLGSAAQRRAAGTGTEAAGTVGGGVRVASIVEDPTPSKLKYEPGHPDADENGYVSLPNVNVVTEMVDMIEATRAYEANVTAINSAKSMALRALEIGRG
ncbi:MAG TPA: flagellar basal body rod protein FlgC [Bacillota bacterium]|jgi:flagellar basal-body rod protein FlgC